MTNFSEKAFSNNPPYKKPQLTPLQIEAAQKSQEIIALLNHAKIHKHRLPHETLFLMAIAFYNTYQRKQKKEEDLIKSIENGMKSIPITGMPLIKFLQLVTDLHDLYQLTNERFYNATLDEEINRIVDAYKAKYRPK